MTYWVLSSYYSKYMRGSDELAGSDSEDGNDDALELNAMPLRYDELALIPHTEEECRPEHKKVINM